MRYSIILAALLWCSQTVLADFVGVKAGAAYWSYDTTGSIRYQGTDASLDSSLQLSENEEPFFWFAFEHAVPILPNVKLMHTKLGLDGGGVVGTSFTLGGATYNTGDDISSSLSLNQTDVILYYNVIDTQVHLDLGINFKIFDGDMKVQSIAANSNESIDFSAPIPMLYANLAFKLPLTGLSIGIEGSATGYDGSNLYDVLARVSYVTKSKIGFEAGYRRLTLDLDDIDDVYSDITLDGPFIAVKFNF